MTTYRRIVKAENGAVLSKEVRWDGTDVITRYHVITRRTSGVPVFVTLEEAQTFFEEETLRVLSTTRPG
jgi:hypothetical protein